MEGREEAEPTVCRLRELAALRARPLLRLPPALLLRREEDAEEPRRERARSWASVRLSISWICRSSRRRETDCDTWQTQRSERLSSRAEEARVEEGKISK